MKSIDSFPNFKQSSNPKGNKSFDKSEGKRSFANIKEARCFRYPNVTHSTNPVRRRRSAEKPSSPPPQRCENPRRSLDNDRNCINITSDSSSDLLIVTEESNDVTMRATSAAPFKEPTNKPMAANPEVKTNNSLSWNDPRNTTLDGHSFGASINSEASTSGIPSLSKSISDPKPTINIQNGSTENPGTSKVYSVSSTIDISSSPDIFTTSSSPEIDASSSVSQIHEKNPRIQHIPIVNGTYLLNANGPHIPNANGPHIPNTNGPHIPNTNGPHIPNANGLYMPNANDPYMPNANDPYMLNANNPYMINANGSYMGNSNGLYMINNNDPYLPNATCSFFLNSNDPYLQNLNDSYMPNANGPYRPNANRFYGPSTSNLFIANTNGLIHPNACNFMANTREPFMPRPLNRCHCPNCFRSMNPNNSPLQFSTFRTPCQLHPNYYGTVLANPFAPTHINSQASYTPVTQAPPLNHSCAPAVSISSAHRDNHRGICNICNCSHAASAHMRSSGNDNSYPGNNTFIRPPNTTHRGYGSFRGYDNQRPRPRDRPPSAFPRAAGGSHKGLPSLRNLPRSSLNNIMPKGKKVTEKYGRACSNCRSNLSKVWKYDEEGKPFCSVCRHFHFHHKRPPPITLADMMKGINRRVNESYESEES